MPFRKTVGALSSRLGIDLLADCLTEDKVSAPHPVQLPFVEELARLACHEQNPAVKGGISSKACLQGAGVKPEYHAGLSKQGSSVWIRLRADFYC